MKNHVYLSNKSFSIVEVREETSPSTKNSIQISYVDICNKNEKNETVITYFQVICNVFGNVFNMIAYYCLHIVLYHFIGKTKDLNLIDGVGLGISYICISLSCFGFGLIEALAIILPRDWAKKNNKGLEITMKQMKFIIAIYLCFNFFLVFFSLKPF